MTDKAALQGYLYIFDLYPATIQHNIYVLTAISREVVMSSEPSQASIS